MMTEKDALALIHSGKSVRDLVTEHAHELELHMDLGRGVIGKAKLELVPADEGDGEMVRATAIAERVGPDGVTRRARFRVDTTLEDAEALFEEAVEANLPALFAKKAIDFLQARNGSRRVKFARQLTTPITKAEHKYIPRREFLAQQSESDESRSSPLTKE